MARFEIRKPSLSPAWSRQLGVARGVLHSAIRGASLFLFLAFPRILLLAASNSPEPIPQARPASRYQTIWENSPFELEAPPPTNAAPESPLSDEFALVGITKVKGKRVVTLLDKKAGTSFDLREDQAKNDIRLLDITVSPDPLLTEVRLSKGSIIGSVGYDKKSLATAPKRPPQAMAPAANAPKVPGVPNPPQSVLNRSPENPNAPQVARRRILSPPITPPQLPGAVPSMPQGIPPPLPVPPGAAPRSSPTPGDRRQLIIPRPPQ